MFGSVGLPANWQAGFLSTAQAFSLGLIRRGGEACAT